MSYQRTGLGAAAGLPAGYAITGYCPGTNIPNWVSKPDGTFECMTDAQIQTLAGVASAAVAATTPLVPAIQAAAPSGSLPTSGQPDSTVQTAPGLLDSAMSWIQANPLLAAGIGVGAVILLGKL